MATISVLFLGINLPNFVQYQGKSRPQRTTCYSVQSKIFFSFYCVAWNADAVWRWEFCLSVRPSVKCVDCDKTEETSVQIFTPYKRTFILVFIDKEWLVGATPSTWNFESTGPRCSEIADFEPIFARGASAVKPSEKSSINTNRKSPTRFPMSLRWSLYVASKPPPHDWAS